MILEYGIHLNNHWQSPSHFLGPLATLKLDSGIEMQIIWNPQIFNDFHGFSWAKRQKKCAYISFQNDRKIPANNGRTACSRAADLVFHLCWVRSLSSWTRSQRPPEKRLSQDADLKSRACGVCISLVLSAQSSGLVSREGVSRPASQCDCWLDCFFPDD